MSALGRFDHGISNRASHRCVVSDGKERAFHIKQFLYDLGPPAFDHPSFWLHSGRPYPVGTHVAWIGHDWGGRCAASLHLDRTLIEIAVHKGYFSDKELLTVLVGFEPVSHRIKHLISITPFAQLCYQSRFLDLIVTVPIGYWHHRRRPDSLLTTAFAAEEIPDKLRKSMMLEIPTSEYKLDTLLVFGGLEDPQEVEWIYQRKDDHCHYLRLLVWPNAMLSSPSFPPKLDRQQCFSTEHTINSTYVVHAFYDHRYGQHEALWRREHLTYMLMVKPAPWTNISWFEQLLKALI